MTSQFRRSSTSDLLRAGLARRRMTVVSIVLLLAALVLGVSTRAASAASIIQAQNSSAAAGGTGAFDVVFTNTNTSAVDVSNFSVQLMVPSGSGISFTGVNVSTTAAAYVFTTLQTSPLTFNTFPTTSFNASDSYASLPGFVIVGAGQTVGLEHVTYSVAGGTHSGPVTVSFLNLGSNTQILDQLDNLIPITATPGTITVSGATVPAPSSLLMGLIAAGSLLVVRWLWNARGRSSLPSPEMPTV